MRRNKSKETTFIFIAIFVLAFILAIFAIKIFNTGRMEAACVFYNDITGIRSGSISSKQKKERVRE